MNENWDEEQENSDEETSAGCPDWMVTFADLMTLLMCFFVLLVAFSEMDVQRYRMIAGSMKMAFGVQRDVRAFEAPKGTSLIAQEYSPGSPTVTPVDETRQVTVDETKPDIRCDPGAQRAQEEAMRDDIEKLHEALGEDVETGLVEVIGRDDRIVIRMQEQGLFAAGQAELAGTYNGVLTLLGETLGSMSGRIAVAGHTDDRPIKNGRYRSNWDLSSARAASVVHLLHEKAGVPVERMVAQGFAHSQPLSSNGSEDGRSMNRRVEISLIRGGQ
jgi:chemotaxis protein MotB